MALNSLTGGRCVAYPLHDDLLFAGFCTSTSAGGRTNVAEAAFTLKSLEAPPYRKPPYNIEAEQALLGAMLVNNDAFHRVADFLTANHFLEPLHGGDFEVISELIFSEK
jgi:hypothetical protein